MGTDIVLTHNGKTVTSLGRAHRFYSDLIDTSMDFDSAFYEKLDSAKIKFLLDFIGAAAEHDQSGGNLSNALEDILNEFVDECLKVGRTQVLSDIINEYSSELKFKLVY